MKILLASPRGFCAGVNMAIETLETAIRLYGTPIYVFHEIVHNKHVVDRFVREGAVFVDRVEDVPEGAVLLFSAHGVAPEVRRVARERSLRAIDATCPLVTKVHLEAIKYARSGHRIMLIGHEGHDEVIGTMGQAPDAFTLVETAEQVDALPFGRRTVRRRCGCSPPMPTSCSCSAARTARTARGSRSCRVNAASGPISSTAPGRSSPDGLPETRPS